MTPAPPIPAPSGARNHQKQEVIDPNKKRTLGQFCWPPLGKSHGRQRAVLTAAAGQILMTIDSIVGRHKRQLHILEMSLACRIRVKAHVLHLVIPFLA